MFWYKFAQTVLWLPSKIFLPTKVVGKKNLPKGGAILICNHQSALDIVLLGLNIYKKQRFLAKKELFETKAKKRFYSSLGGIPVDREKPELSTIKTCIKVLKDDQRLLVFPEGTRKKVNDLQDLKFGFLMFALKAKKPIVPMWIDKRPKLFRFNTLRIGKPIYLNEYFDKKLSEQENKLIEEKILTELSYLKNQQERKKNGNKSRNKSRN